MTPVPPTWSVMIPTYHCAGYLRQTLESVLAQDPGPEDMQIEVVDDASTEDDPAGVVAELGGGRVTFHRHPQNLGHVRNLNSCIQRSRGTLVHLLHGDDRVRPGFYAAMRRPFEDRPDVGAAFCRHAIIDENGRVLSISPLERKDPGVLEDWLPMITVRQRLQTPAMVVRRRVYADVGGFDERIRASGEDWEMWVRIAARYPIWFEPDPLAEYRAHSISLKLRSYPSGQNVRDERRVIEIIRSRLALDPDDPLVRRAMRLCAIAALQRGRQAALRGDLATARAQLMEGWKTSHSPAVLARAIALAVRGSLPFIRRRPKVTP